MKRRLFLPSVFTAVLIGVAVYVNAWAADPVYSSENASPVAQQETPISSTSATAATAKSSVKPKQQATVATTSIATPAPTPSRAVKIAGDSVSIPSIGLQSSVINVGVTATNNIDVPSDLRVGRWIDSAVPGTSGAVFHDGHVDGIFANLHNVKTGQLIKVSYKGKSFSYRIVYKETVRLVDVDMGKALSVYGESSEGLNIMTCAGSFVPMQGTYDHRLIVYAVREL